MKCCSACFGDEILKTLISTARHSEIGNCDYCNAKNTLTVNPAFFRDQFETLISCYSPSRSGKDLEDILACDWGLFDSLNKATSRSLLAEIISNGNLIRKRFNSRKSKGAVLDAFHWDQFREELKHENRFFPKKIPDQAELDYTLTHVKAKNESIHRDVFRARINSSGAALRLEEMGRPPAHLASSGRANPIGIPYLYVASDEMTAVAEVRPSKGERICIASYKLKRTPTLIDLRNPKKIVSPFSVLEEEILKLRSDIAFLSRLGNELSMPVVPRLTQLEYLPSQFLCEFVKNSGYDGIMYKSSVGTGTNYAFFNDKFIKPASVKEIVVNEITHRFSDT